MNYSVILRIATKSVVQSSSRAIYLYDLFINCKSEVICNRVPLWHICYGKETKNMIVTRMRGGIQ